MREQTVGALFEVVGNVAHFFFKEYKILNCVSTGKSGSDVVSNRGIVKCKT